MPVEEAFSLLAQQEPRLLEVADEVVRVAESARNQGDGYAEVRRAVDQVVGRAVEVIGMAGRTDRSSLFATNTALLVVFHHLYEIAGVSVHDFTSDDWPGGA